MFLHPVFSTSAILMKAAGSYSSLPPTFSSPLSLCTGTVVEPEPRWLGLFLCNSLKREVLALSMASLQGDENVFARPSPIPLQCPSRPLLICQPALTWIHTLSPGVPLLDTLGNFTKCVSPGVFPSTSVSHLACEANHMGDILAKATHNLRATNPSENSFLLADISWTPHRQRALRVVFVLEYPVRLWRSGEPQPVITVQYGTCDRGGWGATC
jgi:hypothetical protein